MPRAPQIAATALLIAAVALLHAVGALGLGGAVDLPGSPGNAFFDIDTGRVIADWTAWEESDRARTHPLYKVVAVAGAPLAALLGSPTAAVRLLCIAAIAGQCLLVGALMARLGACVARRMAAMALLGASACGMLLSAIPDTAAVAGLFSLAPFVLLYARRGQPLLWQESLAWIALIVGAFGVTISQVGFPMVALAFRVWWSPAAPRRTARAVLLWLRIVAIAAALIYLLVKAQGLALGTSTRLYKVDDTIRREYKFMETEQLSTEPHLRAGRLLLNVAVHSFAMPPPAIVEWSPPRSPRRFLSLTLVDAPPLQWHGWQWPLLLSHVALAALLLARGRPRRELAPIYTVLAGQMALHLVYGREFIMYAPHWHGLLVVALLAAPAAAPRWLVAWLGLHAAALAASNLAIVEETFRRYGTEFPAERARELIREGDAAVAALDD